MTTRITQLTVVPDNEPIFNEQATTVTIVDESGGEFVVVEQVHAAYGKIAIESNEWPELRAAIDRMVKECKEDKSNQ